MSLTDLKLSMSRKSRAIVERVTGQDVLGPQRMAYVLDLTGPEGMFVAREFQIRDGDTVYVTEAPYSQFSKAIAAALTPLSTAGSIQNLAE